MESQTDASISKLVGEELKKLGDQMQSNTKTLEKKIQRVATETENTQKQLERKLNREEIAA